MWTLTSLNGSASTISYVTYLFVKSGEMPPIEKVLGGNLLSWLAGLAIAFIYLFGRVLGPYRGLYCCVKQEYYKGILVAEMFLVLGVSASFQAFFYSSAFLECRKHPQVDISARKTSLVIVKGGLGMILIFYISYFLIAADAVAVFSSAHTSIWLSGIAACMVKLEPFWHCLLLHHILCQMRKHRTRVCPDNPAGQPLSSSSNKSPGSKVMSSMKNFQTSTGKSAIAHSSLKRKNIYQLPQLQDSMKEDV